MNRRNESTPSPPNEAADGMGESDALTSCRSSSCRSNYSEWTAATASDDS